MKTILALLALVSVAGAASAPDPNALKFDSATAVLPPLSLGEIVGDPSKAPKPLPFASPRISPKATAARPMPAKPPAGRMPIIEPNPAVDFKIAIVTPNPDIDFKIRNPMADDEPKK